MDKKLLISIIIAAICWGLLVYTAVRMHGEVIEAVDDEAWTCTALGKTDLMGVKGDVIGKIAKGDSLHLLASSSAKRDMVMVQTSDGTRGWVNNTILPNYYKIRSIDIDEPAHFNSTTFKKHIIGYDLKHIEEKYAAALQIVPEKPTKTDKNRFYAVFPMQVQTKGIKKKTTLATIQFEDGKAVAVETDSIFSKKAARNKIDPLIFVFLDNNIMTKAMQKASPEFTSKLPEGVEKERKGNVSTVFGLLLVLILLVVLTIFPILLIGPLLVLVFLFISDDFYKWLLAIIIVSISIILCFTVYSITNSVSYLLLIANIIAAIVTLIYCENEVY